jgi:hypothetical protein
MKIDDLYSRLVAREITLKKHLESRQALLVRVTRACEQTRGALAEVQETLKAVKAAREAKPAEPADKNQPAATEKKPASA